MLWEYLGPGSHKSPSPLTSIHGAILAFESLEVGILFTRGPKYKMDAYMATFCEGEARVCVESRVELTQAKNYTILFN